MFLQTFSLAISIPEFPPLAVHHMVSYKIPINPTSKFPRAGSETFCLGLLNLNRGMRWHLSLCQPGFPSKTAPSSVTTDPVTLYSINYGPCVVKSDGIRRRRDLSVTAPGSQNIQLSFELCSFDVHQGELLLLRGDLFLQCVRLCFNSLGLDISRCLVFLRLLPCVNRGSGDVHVKLESWRPRLRFEERRREGEMHAVFVGMWKLDVAKVRPWLLVPECSLEV